MTEHEINLLLRLSGMKLYSGYHTAKEWKQLTGVDPKRFPKLIRITRGGACVWTPEAERIYQAHTKRVNRNWQSLGINNQ